ncbi:MAG: 2-C-methyl-D-erythritol 4-phosphate cytidylyltransferase [Longimicrobiales bacterium]
MSEANSEGPARVGVAIPAAGFGRRMGGARKPLLQLAGEPILVHALRPFLADPRVTRIAVAMTADDVKALPDWLTGVDDRVVVVEGGDTRGASVARAIAALPDDVSVIAVHDAARPLVTRRVIAQCIDLAHSGFGAVAGSPAIDTIKRVDGRAFVTGTPDRSTLWQAHTPQVFPADELRAAYASGVDTATDDAALVEAAGGRIRMVDDGGTNLKVTRPVDLVVAEAILSARDASN